MTNVQCIEMISHLLVLCIQYLCWHSQNRNDSQLPIFTKTHDSHMCTYMYNVYVYTVQTVHVHVYIDQFHFNCSWCHLSLPPIDKAIAVVAQPPLPMQLEYT